MRSFAPLFALLAVSATAATIPDDDTPPIPTVRSIGYAGTGCPQGSLRVATEDTPHSGPGIYADLAGQSLDIVYGEGENTAVVGNGAAPSAQRRACTAQIEVTYKGGWQFALDVFKFNAHVDTDVGVTGQLVVKYFFSGVPGISSTTTNIPGGTHGDGSVTWASPEAWAKKPKTVGMPPYANSTMRSNGTSPAGGNLTSNGMAAGHTLPAKFSTNVYSPCGGNGVVNLQTSVAMQQNTPGTSGSMYMKNASARFVWMKCPPREPRREEPKKVNASVQPRPSPPKDPKHPKAPYGKPRRPSPTSKGSSPTMVPKPKEVTGTLTNGTMGMKSSPSTGASTSARNMTSIAGSTMAEKPYPMTNSTSAVNATVMSQKPGRAKNLRFV